MPAIGSEDITSYIKLRTDLSGVGPKSWDDLFPPGEVLNLSDANPVMLRILEAYREMPPDPALEQLLDNVGQLRILTEFGPEGPFLEPTDPSREHPVGPGPIDPATLLPGMRPPEPVNGMPVVLDPPQNWRHGGARGFRHKQAMIRTDTWRSRGGTVRFKLHEGSRFEGPWTLVKTFKLGPNQVHNEQFQRKEYVQDHWWLLTVEAISSASEFTAEPFAY